MIHVSSCGMMTASASQWRLELCCRCDNEASDRSGGEDNGCCDGEAGDCSWFDLIATL
ncbi:hypothetical protein TSUD_280030 [Trifolium subterraneum]|uniref:Uncharacterized protein n=1 Tax=Trifolium subterraneum TaxID=3900 RepID=A0A2Z6M396_TRISU|nr:hypothetical protein TSUD_280030 [Trifolium subterraneum]